MKSLSRRFLISVGLMSLVMTVLGTLGAFMLFERELSNRQIGYLTDYVRERSDNVDRQFTGLSSLHQAAAEELERRMDHLDAAAAGRLADVYFPMQADGTRRSAPQFNPDETVKMDRPDDVTQIMREARDRLRAAKKPRR